jgi:hypothetical protein
LGKRNYTKKNIKNKKIKKAKKDETKRRNYIDSDSAG